MWSAEAAALMWIGLQSERFWFRIGGLALFAVAIGVWLQSVPPEREGVVRRSAQRARAVGLFVIAMLYLVAAVQRAAAGPTDGRRRTRPRCWWRRTR